MAKFSSEDLGTKSISKLLIRQSLPASIGILVMSLNILVDTIFVGNWIGSIAIAAINVVLPVSFFIAALGMAIASFAKSFKEANNYLTPMLFLIVILSFGSYGISIDDVGIIPFLIPILNVTLVIQEVLVNNFNAIHMLVTISSTLLVSIIMIMIASWIFHKESVLFRA